MKLNNRHGSVGADSRLAAGERAGAGAVKQNQTVARQGRRGGELSHQRCRVARMQTSAAASSALTPKPQQLQELRKRSYRSLSSSSASSSPSPVSATAFIKPIRSLRLIPLSVVLLLIISILCGSASANTLSGVRRDRQRSAEIDRLARKGGLLIDRSEPPLPAMALYRRETHHSSSSSSSSATSSATSSPSPSSSPSSSTATRASSTQSATSSTATPDEPQSTTLPTPFDTNLASNFTSTSCPAFFNKFLSNTDFQNCHPLSLLLQNSNSFFDASKSFVRITQTLDASCNVNFKSCLALMQQYATDIISTDNCGTDYKIGNAMVSQAYNGFQAYQPLYEAGCLRDSQGNYCFADAITNKTSATDSYPYYIALGSELPASTRPTCNSCLQNTMAVFNSFAGNSNQPVSKTYVNAAQQIDISCGPTFANTTVHASRASSVQAAPYNLFLGLLATAMVFLL